MIFSFERLHTDGAGVVLLVDVDGFDDGRTLSHLLCQVL